MSHTTILTTNCVITYHSNKVQLYMQSIIYDNIISTLCCIYSKVMVWFKVQYSVVNGTVCKLFMFLLKSKLIITQSYVMINDVGGASSSRILCRKLVPKHIRIENKQLYFSKLQPPQTSDSYSLEVFHMHVCHGICHLFHCYCFRGAII